jgi:hypothetical protein
MDPIMAPADRSLPRAAVTTGKVLCISRACATISVESTAKALMYSWAAVARMILSVIYVVSFRVLFFIPFKKCNGCNSYQYYNTADDLCGGQDFAEDENGENGIDKLIKKHLGIE